MPRTIAEILKAHGYATGAFVANRVLSARLGYNQGFDTFDVFPSDLSSNEPAVLSNLIVKGQAETLQQASLAWLDRLAAARQAGQPVFLYVHYTETHAPYAPPQQISDQMLRRHANAARLHPIQHDLLASILRPVSHDEWQHPDADVLTVIEDLYDAEVLTLDARLREFFAALDRRDFLTHSVVVVLADHGEEFLDHGAMNHGSTLYNELIHVPLLVVAPEQTRRVDIADVASVIDVAPTLLTLAAITRRPASRVTR